MSQTSITIEEIRTYLGEIDAEELPDTTIQAAIDAAQIVVDARLEDTTVDADLRHQIVVAVAARRAFMSSPIESRRSALDATVEFEVEEYIEELRARVEELYNLVGESTGGTSAAFATSTRGAFTGTRHSRDRRF